MTSADLEEVWRRFAPEVLAALVRRSGDFDTAEDAVQEALLAAARQWPAGGTPDDPKAWLIRVASRRLVDQRRAEQARADRELRVARHTPPEAFLAPAADTSGGSERDDSLTLLLLCCHPALTRPSQVALTLGAVAGLSTTQIARAFLVPEATLAQRISRAKARLGQVGARFTLPSAGELPGRVAAVAQVLYLIFTEGHTASAGTALQRVELTGEAIRLARQLHDHLPDDGEVTGLLALMLLTDAGVRLREAALPTGPVGPYQLQAAIAAVHAEAPGAAATDWAQIETLYRMLDALAPGPVVTLNHAVAVAMVDGPAAGLATLEPLREDRRLRHHHRLHAVHAHLLEMAGKDAEARTAYATAARLATSIPEQRYLNARAARRAPG